MPAYYRSKIAKMSNTSKRRAKIVATVGPACSSYEDLLLLFNSGVDVFRLNFSHGSHDQHAEVINHILYLREKYKSHVSILADLQGPKIRLGEIENAPVDIAPGHEFELTSDDIIGNKDRIHIQYADFHKDVQSGERVMIDDGKVICEILETDKKNNTRLKVLYGNALSSKKGVNLPDTKVSLPSLTEKDLRDLEFILKYPVNWIALSFVRTATELRHLAKLIEQKGHDAKIIAKIEKPEAMKNFKKIVRSCNAVMVARGDLGVEIAMERIPHVQKEIIDTSIQYARPVIVATQMMESMIENPSPTRAEVTDVANAILDGADCVMLSGETSIGNHPAKVVETMSKIIEETEKYGKTRAMMPILTPKSKIFLSDAVCFSAANLAEETKAKVIVGMTTSGYTAYKISSQRPRATICIFSSNHDMLSTLNLVWGVRCFYYDKYSSTDETIADVQKILRSEGLITSGDVVINSGSMPIHKRLRTNMLKLSVVE